MHDREIGIPASPRGVRVLISAVLFDLDMTLFDRALAMRRWLLAACQSTGVDAVDHVVDELIILDANGYCDRSEFLRTMQDRVGVRVDIEDFRRGLIAHAPIGHELHQVLGDLSRRCRLGLLTNGSSDMQRRKIAHLGIGAILDPILISGETGHRKPAPAAFQQALQAWDLLPQHVCMVGDHAEFDIRGAQAVGMRTCWIGSEWEGDNPPDCQCEQIVDLPGVFAACDWW